MFGVMLVIAVVAIAATAVYLVRERLGAAGAGMAVLRTVAVGALLVLLLNPSSQRPGDAMSPTVLLDASLSLAAAGGRWDAALDTARRLAGGDGIILRFGDRVTAFDTTAPEDGRSLVVPALRAAAGRGGPVYIVSDGELADFAAGPAALRASAAVVLVGRDTVPNAAVLDVAIDARVRRDDSVRVTLEIGTWGALPDTTATLVVASGGRELIRRAVSMPPAPAVARRTVVVPPRLLPLGTHVLEVRLAVAGDREPRDDARVRVVTVAALPAVVLVSSPADWEGRFLMRDLAEITRADVRGFAEITPGRWVDMSTVQPVTAQVVQDAARGATLLVARGAFRGGRAGQPRWDWPSASGAVRFTAGDWYPAGEVPSSPLAGRLGVVDWDSLPPLTGIVPIAPTDGEWTALSTRLGRRGAERPAVLGRDSAGTRHLTTAAGGLWRWALRGGAAREAYRAIVAAGVDWLLGSGALARQRALTAGAVVQRGMPVLFHWRAEAPPEDMEVELVSADTTVRARLSFDAAGTAAVRAPVGSYRWRVPAVTDAGGVTVVEPYSDEFHPGPVTAASAAPPGLVRMLLVNARDRWWIFVLVVAAFVGEWAWRTRRGLP